MNQSCYVGIDVAKASFEVATDRDRETARFAYTASGIGKLLRKLAVQRPVTLICLEATGGYERRLATALAAGGDTRAAVEQLEETLRRTPDFPRAHFSLGAIRALQGRQQEAVEHYRTALRLQEGYVEARMGLAEALRGAGRLAEALPHYLRVTEIDPGFAEAWFGRADALVRLGRLEEARAWLAEARAVHPDWPELARLEAAVGSPGAGR